ncbi:EF-hand domain-containing protein [Erythrobacter sp. SG61-1L]|uniref:EF-hand domain-containing protein n=1 Tax=Erythrobacter sp. SG61-1L TaxID=1603897 RepID=UPI0006C8F9A7|nr:EF-hand domain-containing protein [Erythrobacter sp. SG61-1L]
MSRFLPTLAVALALAAPSVLAAQEVQYGGDMSRIKRPNGAPPSTPIARKKFDQAVEKIFRAADTDRDGTITLAEFNAAIEARKAAMIARRFAEVDTDRNRQISPEEFAAWQRTLGSAVLAEDGMTSGEQIALVAEQLPVELGKDREDEVLEDVIAPITATLIVEANTNYDGGVSLEELLAFEGARFDKADLNKDGWLVADEIVALREGPGTMRPQRGGPAGAPGAAPGGAGSPPPPPPGN